MFLLTLRCQNEKACFSDIENTPTHDYAITFADVQALQKLKDKVLRASMVLSLCLELADRLIAFCWQLEAQGLLPNASNIPEPVELYAADIKSHQTNIAMFSSL